MIFEDRKLGGRYNEGIAPVPIVEIQRSTSAEIFSEAVSLTSGNNSLYLKMSPIFSFNGDRLGHSSDTSLSFSAQLTTEVNWQENFRTTNSLSAGQYSVHYETGLVIYNSASSTSVTASYKIRVEPQSVETVDTPEAWEDTSFTVGESPATIDINVALGHNATDVLIINDGPGEFDYSVSNDGSVFGDNITLKRREFKRYSEISIDSLRITHSGTDSAYRIEAI